MMFSVFGDYWAKWWLKKLENFTARDETLPRQPGDHLNAQIPLDPAASRATNPKPKPRDKISLSLSSATQLQTAGRE